MRRWTKYFAWGAVALVIAIAVGWLVLDRSGARASQRQESTAPKKIRVTVVHPQTGGVPWSVTRPASIHAFYHVDLYAKEAGFLQHQTVDIGDKVKKDQVIAQIYAPEIEAGVVKANADVRKAEAMVNVAHARVDEAKANLVEAGAKLDESKADLISADATLTLRQEQLARIAELAKLNSIQEELVDEKRAAERSAEADRISALKAVDTAQAGVASAAAGVARSEADLANAQADVQVAQAEQTQATTMEDYTRIRAPFDGVVTKRNFQNGDFIRNATSGATQPVLSVSETDLMRVIVWVPDQDVPNTRQGVPVTLNIDALNGHE
ncbi:MAG TPA: efflux RND transporter periplasmic adaptor subunit, partial [Pirellulales bacterium]|nr:efflux RND transporter periplasmic adaptor subunit [Pirellulales bacterium]